MLDAAAMDRPRPVVYMDISLLQTWMPMLLSTFALFGAVALYHWHTDFGPAGPAAVALLVLTIVWLVAKRDRFSTGTLDCTLLIGATATWLLYGMAWDGAGVVYSSSVAALACTIAIVVGVSLTYAKEASELLNIKLWDAPLHGVMLAVGAALLLPNESNVAPALSTPLIVGHVMVSAIIFLVSEYLGALVVDGGKVEHNGASALVTTVRIAWPLWVHNYALVAAVLQLLPHLMRAQSFISGKDILSPFIPEFAKDHQDIESAYHDTSNDDDDDGIVERISNEYVYDYKVSAASTEMPSDHNTKLDEIVRMLKQKSAAIAFNPTSVPPSKIVQQPETAAPHINSSAIPTNTPPATPPQQHQKSEFTFQEYLQRQTRSRSLDSQQQQQQPLEKVPDSPPIQTQRR
jgi:hypothetical protein